MGYMKYICLLLLLPLLSFGQSKKDLKARVYSMQLDSVNQVNALVDLLQKNSDLNDRISELTITLSKANELIEIIDQKTVVLEEEIEALNVDLKHARDSIRNLLNELVKYSNLNQCAYYMSLPQEEIDLLVELQIKNELFKPDPACNEVSQKSFRFTGDEIYVDGAPTGGEIWGIDYVVGCVEDEPVIRFSWGPPMIKYVEEYFIEGGFFLDATSQCKSFPEKEIVPETPEIDDNITMHVPAQKACFVGADGNCDGLVDEALNECCTRSILKYLSEVSYPEQAMDLGIQGKVLIRFMVEKDGSVSQIEKIRGDDMLAASAIEHIKNTSGMWIPATNNGKPARSYFTSPFSFKLRDEVYGFNGDDFGGTLVSKGNCTPSGALKGTQIVKLDVCIDHNADIKSINLGLGSTTVDADIIDAAICAVENSVFATRGMVEGDSACTTFTFTITADGLSF